LGARESVRGLDERYFANTHRVKNSFRITIYQEPAGPIGMCKFISASSNAHHRCRLAEEETTLTTQSNEAARIRAEASFRKEERAKEGAKAMMEYRANSRMIREKTERLKALRLAKQAADKERAG
jgi:hypothetical protein